MVCNLYLTRRPPSVIGKFGKTLDFLRIRRRSKRATPIEDRFDAGKSTELSVELPHGAYEGVKFEWEVRVRVCNGVRSFLSERRWLTTSGRVAPTPTPMPASYKRLVAEEKSLPRPRRHSHTIGQIIKMLSDRASFEEKLKRALENKEITESQYAELSKRNREHSGPPK